MLLHVGNLSQCEIIVGTYEEFLLGYKIDRNNEGALTFTQNFATHSHNGSVRSVAAAGKYLASGSTDEHIQLYDLEERKEKSVLVRHNGTITSLEFFEQAYLFSGSEDGNICAWRTNNWQCEKVLKAHEGGVLGLSIHPTGKLALSIGKDKTLKTWNLVKGRSAYITRQKVVPDFVKWSVGGGYYAVGSGNHLDIYSVELAGIVYSAECRPRVNCIAFITDDIFAIAIGGDVEIHKISEKSKILSFKAHDKRTKCMCVLQLSKYKCIVTGSSEGIIRLWKYKVKNCKKPPELIGEINTTCRITCMTVALTCENINVQEQKVSVIDDVERSVHIDCSAYEEKNSNVQEEKVSALAGVDSRVDIDHRSEKMKRKRKSTITLNDSDMSVPEMVRSEGFLAKKKKSINGSGFTVTEITTFASTHENIDLQEKKISARTDVDSLVDIDCRTSEKKKRKSMLTLNDSDMSVAEMDTSEGFLAKKRKRSSTGSGFTVTEINNTEDKKHMKSKKKIISM